ncbi:hypothetical protein ANN_24822 [Periplaneta americana]|uniref:Uncharacterized protein n=1 Tax=Periplaneta americana TaxID=6978 RepID=A0ABQ8RZY9_PERAM|nr:hypothetical protein ANN_24822 [Periplaneta americana]
MSPGSSTESYPAFARIGLRKNPGQNLNQVTCPDRDSNPGHLVSRPDALTVTPQTANPSIGTTHPHPYHRQLHIAEPKSAVVQETLKTTTNSVETGRLSKVRLFVDCKIYRQISDESDIAALQNDLNVIETWPTEYIMKINVSKRMGEDDDENEERTENPVLARSLLLSNSTKEAARLNVPIRRTNHYQQ